MALGDVWKLRTLAVCFSQNGLCILHYQVTAQAGTGAVASQIANALNSTISAAFQAILNNNAQYRGVGAQKIWPLPIQLEATAVSLAGLGTAGAVALPGQVAGLVSWRTALAGRTGRGRSFFPFPSAADNAGGGDPTGGYVSRLTTLAGMLQTPITAGTGGNTSTLGLVLWNRKTFAATPVTGNIVSAQWWSQRRREFGRKPDLAPF